MPAGQELLTSSVEESVAAGPLEGALDMMVGRYSTDTVLYSTDTVLSVKIVFRWN